MWGLGSVSGAKLIKAITGFAPRLD